MAKSEPDRKCQHLLTRSPRHPVADLPCGATAKWFIHNTTHKEDLCGTHAAYWRRRGFTPMPIITLKTDLDGNPI